MVKLILELHHFIFSFHEQVIRQDTDHKDIPVVIVFHIPAEYVALYMRSIGHESLFFYYVSFAAFISLLVYVFALKGHRSVLDDEA
ncbi:hypothetical protein [Lactobacillus delbrueckii]|nr:hypothetical protein [Lactobacillus delbrueckii]